MTSNTMTRPARPLSMPFLGRAGDMPRRQNSDIAVTNVAVRTSDRAAFLAIIAAREQQIAAGINPHANIGAAAIEIADLLDGVGEDIASGSGPELIAQTMHHAAARTIAILIELQATT